MLQWINCRIAVLVTLPRAQCCYGWVCLFAIWKVSMPVGCYSTTTLKQGEGWFFDSAISTYYGELIFMWTTMTPLCDRAIGFACLVKCIKIYIDKTILQVLFIYKKNSNEVTHQEQFFSRILFWICQLYPLHKTNCDVHAQYITNIVLFWHKWHETTIKNTIKRLFSNGLNDRE